MERGKKIVRTSIIGIIANVVLSLGKAAVGLISGSIAIVLDAVNNLSDALSSGITVVGTKLAAKKPDKKHPYGYGRIEYISAMIIAVIILYAGITSLEESIKKIISPTAVNYEIITISIIAAAIVVKIFLGIYFQKVGKSVGSDSLIASGKDALLDSIISATTLVAALIFTLSKGKLSIEAWLGAAISLLIIKSGIEIMIHTISEIVGERLDAATAKAIKGTIESFPEVYGAYDLILHSYGPEVTIGSVHIEVPDYMVAHEIDLLEHRISEKVYLEHKVIITGISIYSKNTKNDGNQAIFAKIREMVMARDYVLQMHGFYIDESEKTIHFDVVIDFAAPDREKVYREILKEVSEEFSDYSVTVTLDSDISD